MKKNSVNTFTEGLICDLDPINVSNNVLTDCLNGTIITHDGNEYSLQNDKGNFPLKDCKLRENFIPVGIKEYNGILYIVSLNPLTGEEEIGSYPSPKLPDGGTVNGTIDIDYVIDKAFDESNTSELDYSDLESKCKSVYYSNPNLKINVGDRFTFEHLSLSTNLEKIEKYIIDENSVEHLILDDWLNSNKEYVSPISGTICLKNKLFTFENSSAEIDAFVCWNESTSSNSELGVLFSFTHKLYIDDPDSLEWISDDLLKYKIDLKINDDIIHSGIYENIFQKINDTSSDNRYKCSIESEKVMSIDWYQDNKIISKRFNSIIKGVSLDDEISIDITPIIEKSSSQNIILSKFMKPLTSSVSEHVQSDWQIANELYKFYNSKDNDYSKQYIELNISGPIEVDDFILKCDIKDYDSENIIYSVEFDDVGIGKNLIEIDYTNDFVKEDAYTINYSIYIAGEEIMSVNKNLITSQLFNYEEYINKYDDYTTIPSDIWMSKYWDVIEGGSLTMVLGEEYKLPNSLYTYITGNEDYVNRDIMYPNFIDSESYEEYSKFKEARLSGNLYDATISVENPTYLQGPLWEINESTYLEDALGKQTEINESEINLQVPAGSGIFVNFNQVAKTIGGRIQDIEVLIPSKYTYTFNSNVSEDLSEFTVEVLKNAQLVKTINLNPINNSFPDTDITNEIKECCMFDEEMINIELIFNYEVVLPAWATGVTVNYNGESYVNDHLILNNIFKVANGVNGWFIKIPDTNGQYIKIMADKDEKYHYGYWCGFSSGENINFHNPHIKLSKHINVTSKVGETKEFIWERTVVDNSITINNLQLVKAEIEQININGIDDENRFKQLTKNIVPYSGDYVKGLVDTETKDYTPVTQLSKQYRIYDKLEFANPITNQNIQCWAESKDGKDSVQIYFGTTNGGIL